MNHKAEILERERRWALPAGILSVLGVVLIAISYVYSGSQVPSGDGVAEFLGNVDANRGGLVFANLLQAVGYVMLLGPLVYMFRAAEARTERVKAGLIGLIIVAPIFLGGAAITNAVSNLHAATEFKEKSAAPVEACINEKNADNGSSALGATESQDTSKTGDNATGDTATTDAGETGSSDSSDESSEEIATDCANDTATDFQQDAPTQGITVGLGLAGALGFTISIVYIALWSMRVGLLSRFWGSLGIALGAVSILFPQFTLLFFIYLGLVITGLLPGGRPPAWEEGEAVPWLPPGSPDDDGNGDVIEGTAEPVDGDPAEGEAPDFPAGDDAPQIERRKRKRRNS